MENKAFLIDFEAVVNAAGTLQIKAETEAHARLKMAEIIKQAHNPGIIKYLYSLNK